MLITPSFLKTIFVIGPLVHVVGRSSGDSGSNKLGTNHTHILPVYSHRTFNTKCDPNSLFQVCVVYIFFLICTDKA